MHLLSGGFSDSLCRHGKVFHFGVFDSTSVLVGTLYLEAAWRNRKAKVGLEKTIPENDLYDLMLSKLNFVQVVTALKLKQLTSGLDHESGSLCLRCLWLSLITEKKMYTLSKFIQEIKSKMKLFFFLFLCLDKKNVYLIFIKSVLFHSSHSISSTFPSFYFKLSLMFDRFLSFLFAIKWSRTVIIQVKIARFT